MEMLMKREMQAPTKQPMMSSKKIHMVQPSQTSACKSELEGKQICRLVR